MNEQDRETVDEPLEPWLAEAVRALPRERAASDLLEQRTVRGLRAAGVLGAAVRHDGWRRIAAVAAAVALFASGMAAGQWLGTEQTANALARQQQATIEEMAALVERTGSAYVGAMARLADTGGDGAASEPAREAALQMLHQAANEVVRMAPNDPVAVKILQGLDHAALQGPAGDARERRRQIMWF